jgi:hypothetical protein
MQPEEMTPADLPMRDKSPDASSPPTPALLRYQVELGELTMPATQAPDQVQITAILAGQCPGTDVQTWTYDYVNILDLPLREATCSKRRASWQVLW